MNPLRYSAPPAGAPLLKFKLQQGKFSLAVTAPTVAASCFLAQNAAIELADARRKSGAGFRKFEGLETAQTCSVQPS
jgi:hypothetical protein